MTLIKREFVFIDGENLLFRYQDMLSSGKKPRSGVTHERDVFVWSNHAMDRWIGDIMRTTYYTSCTGAPERLAEVEELILSRTYQFQAPRMEADGRLIPRVFKKDKKSQKSRRVDINISIDSLWHGFRNDYEVCVLFSGDGDFVSLVEAIQRLGKQVHVHAFSSGLDHNLRRKADSFHLLDHFFFENEAQPNASDKADKAHV